MGILYIVATPIGNLEDITIRAIKTLASVDGIASEDTRKTGMLLKHLKLKYPEFYLQSPEHRQKQRLFSYFEHNEFQRIPEIINALKNDLTVAVVSDAGTPGISDPGFRLIRECIREGIPVVTVPGPSSVISALVTSGLPTDKFLFLGYPPHKGGKRMQLYTNLQSSMKYINATIIFFESPHKLLKTLDELLSVFGDITLTLGHELTKIHESTIQKSISDWKKYFIKAKPRGEYVLLFHEEL